MLRKRKTAGSGGFESKGAKTACEGVHRPSSETDRQRKSREENLCRKRPERKVRDCRSNLQRSKTAETEKSTAVSELKREKKKHQKKSFAAVRQSKRKRSFRADNRIQNRCRIRAAEKSRISGSPPVESDASKQTPPNQRNPAVVRVKASDGNRTLLQPYVALSFDHTIPENLCIFNRESENCLFLLIMNRSYVNTIMLTKQPIQPIVALPCHNIPYLESG